MNSRRLTRDDELATEAERAITSALLNLGAFDEIDHAEDDGPVEVNVIESYEEQGLLTRDRGLVVFLSDGRELHLTITAYGPAR